MKYKKWATPYQNAPITNSTESYYARKNEYHADSRIYQAIEERRQTDLYL